MAFASVLLLSAATIASAQDIHVRLLNEETREPLAGVLVAVLGAEAAVGPSVLATGDGIATVRVTGAGPHRLLIRRIGFAPVTTEPITHGAADVKLPDTLFEGSADDLIVTIDVATSAAPLLADYIPDGAVTVEKDGRLRTSVRVSHYHGLKRLIASMPGVAIVVGPPDARAAVREWAAAGAARYQ